MAGGHRHSAHAMEKAIEEAPGADDNARAAFVYQETLRGLLQQQAAVESLRARAASLIFAASFASSLLGSQALQDGVRDSDWIALALLVAIGGSAVFTLWPYYNLTFTFRFDPEDLLARYVDPDEPMPLASMNRELALQIKADGQRNGASCAASEKRCRSR